jgi:gliding motility-associated-like protein
LSKPGLLPCESLSHIICFLKGNRRALIRPWLYIPFLVLLASDTSAQTMVAQFGADKTSGCAGLVVQFRDLTTGNPKYWNWDFGNGTLSTVQNPVVSYGAPGRYTVTLVVRNADGTTGITKTDYITVTPSPGADFTSNITTGCVPVTVQFTDQSTAGGGIASWQWDFGDGTTSTQQHPQKTYDKTGFYSVSLTVTSNSGCRSTSVKQRYIRIVPGVKAEFDLSKAGSCQPPFPVEFINNTSGPGNMTFQWDLGNGNTSTAANPSTTYTGTGTFNVTLTATSEFGCSGTITKPITLDGPTTAIKVPDTVCQNQKVWFVNESSGTPQKVRWDFGNGQVSPHLNDSTVYPAAGNHTVKLVNTYAACVDSAIKTIYVRSSPDIDFSVSNAVSCKSPLPVTFSDATPVATIVDWKWDFGDGSSGTGKTTTHTYSTTKPTDSFNVSVIFTDNFGCEGRITKQAIVKIVKPTVDITNVPAGGCIPYTFSPVANVQAVDGVQSWLWDFGDGNTSTSPTPTNTYVNTGKYTVKLTITTNDGCTETKTVPNAVLTGTPPVVDFSMSGTDVCASAPVQFTDLTTPAAQLNKWEWSFGDGGTSTEQNPLYKFQNIGTFTVILKAYNNGCPATSVGKTITIRPPIPKFTYTVSCGALTVNFIDQSIVDPAFGPISYSWNFGDGSPVSNAKDPVHSFPALNTPYTVTLTVTNGTCTDIFTQTVKLVQELPNFTISQPACRNAPVTLTSTNNPQNITWFEWAFDGGAYDSSDRDTTVAFNTFGNHTISFRITDINGCVYVKNDAVNVIGPTAAFTSNNPGGCKNDTVTFTDNSTPAGSITKWTFDFGDGQSQSFTQPPFRHAYKDTGEYKVKLTVQDNVGCIDIISLTDTIFIGQLRPWFYADYDTICPTSSLQFYDSSEGKSLSYLWHFGDGTTSALQNPTHIYGGSETSYNVKLVISDRGGCKDSVTRNRYITTIKPKPAFDIQDTTTICPPIETKFTFRGSDYDSLYWDFGDGFTSTLPNPTHFYNTYGDFEAKLYLLGYGGCLDSASHMVHVYEPNANTTWSYSPLDACNELTVDFSITTPPGTSFTFYFGDGTFDTSQVTTFRHYYGSPAYYHPSVLLTDAQQCQIGVGGPALIKVIGADPFFGVDRKKFCDSGVVFFTNYTIGNDPVVNRVWNFGDGSPTTDVEHPIHYYQEPGTFLASQTVTTQTGCTKTVTDSIRVYRTPEPIIGGDTIACINEPFNFKGLLAVPDTAITWSWDMGNRTHLTTQDISLTFADSGNYTLYLKATNLLGCTDSTSTNIYVPPTPQIAIEEEPVIPVTTGVTLPVSYGPNIATYTWTPAKNLSCTDCPTPYADPKFTTTYKIKVEDIYGCTNTKNMTVTVICNGLNYFLPNTFSPNGDGVNDVFAPRGVGLTRINNMRIFNRWGELVFEKMNFLANDRSPSGGWDGTYKGKPASPDVYVYIVEFVCENAQVVPVKGNVALIR